jgi:LmbE family N-acetylglucosaminyl deacetylase
MKVLVVAPHADDETLGAGGTIARLADEGHSVTVAVLTGHGTEGPHPIWSEQTFRQIREEGGGAWETLGVSEVLFREIPAVAVSRQPIWELNELCLEVLQRVEPEILFVPFQLDLHEDHRALFRSFSVAWRPSSKTGQGVREIYCYETNSETHWNFHQVEGGFLPNVWIDISSTLERKLEALSCFRSQIREAPEARSLEAVRALAIWRGSQAGMAAAEAFVLVRRFV